MSTRTAADLIKKWEGYSDVPYQDSAGFWTIGYGHRIVAGDPYYPQGAQQKITRAEADALLARDMATARAAVLQYTRVPLTSAQLDGLTSFVYNVGVNAYRNSTMLRKLNEGDYTGAAGEFGRWIYAGGQRLAGLVNRRADEQQTFNSGTVT